MVSANNNVLLCYCSCIHYNNGIYPVKQEYTKEQIKIHNKCNILARVITHVKPLLVRGLR